VAGKKKPNDHDKSRTLNIFLYKRSLNKFKKMLNKRAFTELYNMFFDKVGRDDNKLLSHIDRSRATFKNIIPVTKGRHLTGTQIHMK